MRKYFLLTWAELIEQVHFFVALGTTFLGYDFLFGIKQLHDVLMHTEFPRRVKFILKVVLSG